MNRLSFLPSATKRMYNSIYRHVRNPWLVCTVHVLYTWCSIKLDIDTGNIWMAVFVCAYVALFHYMNEEVNLKTNKQNQFLSPRIFFLLSLTGKTRCRVEIFKFISQPGEQHQKPHNVLQLDVCYSCPCYLEYPSSSFIWHSSHSTSFYSTTKKKKKADESRVHGRDASVPWVKRDEGALICN